MHEGAKVYSRSRERELAFENPEFHRRAQILLQAKPFNLIMLG